VQALQTLVKQAIGPTIVVTHHLPHRDLCWQKPHDIAWTALHGSFANTGLESITDPKIKMWIYGHTHQRGMTTINGQQYMCNARGYPGENPGWVPVVFDIDENTGIISW
jgi:Icc-related predicted phosphoesterase